jgi:asparagine synthase (glutamine-hydrolysing)
VSGFVGLWQHDGRPVDAGQLAALTESLRFRGPDGLGAWHRGAVGLGHARFVTHAQCDGEPQPLGLDNRYWITGDVRLDAREELVAALGHSERSEESLACSDAALVLRAYRAWGAQCAARIRGDFAFAIWDETGQRLFCARDPFGIKPFFYAQFTDLFLFSNTLNCLRRHPRVSSRLDELALADYLCSGRLLEQHMSCFADIRRLPPGHLLVISPEGIRTDKYWDLPVEPYLRYREPRQYIEHFRDVFSRAVADRAGGGPLSIFLSGGLDSGAIAGAAMGRLGGPTVNGPVRAYTVGWNCAFQDPEPEHAQITAAALDLPVEVLEEPDCQPLKSWGKAGGPEVDDNHYRESFVRTLRHMAEFSRVALNGQGGDEVFYRELLVDEARRNAGWRLAVEAVTTWRVTGRRPPIGIRGLASRNGAPHHAGVPAWIDPEWSKRLNLPERLATLGSPPQEPEHLPHAAARTRLNAPFWMAYVEPYDAGHSGALIDTRWPFLDHRVIRFALALPPFPWCVDKHLLRRALHSVVPDRIATRPKTTLQGALLSTHLARHPAWLQAATSSATSLAGSVDASAWSAATREHPALSDSTAWSLARPVSASLWLTGVSHNPKRAPNQSRMAIQEPHP